MTLSITKATELKLNNVTYLIYANPGVGKTSSIKHMPGKKLVIDIDKSSSVLKGETDIDIVSLNTHDIWNQWMEVIKLLKEQAKNYDIIAIDNISELFRSVLTQLGREGKNNRVPGMDAYQRADFVLMDSFRALQGLGKTLVFTAWETTDQYHNTDGQIFTRAMPEIRKPILNNFMGLCDVVARLVVTKDEEENEKRGFILQPTQSVYAKNRLSEHKGCKVEELFDKTLGSDSDET